MVLMYQVSATLPECEVNRVGAKETSVLNYELGVERTHFFGDGNEVAKTLTPQTQSTHLQFNLNLTHFPAYVLLKLHINILCFGMNSLSCDDVYMKTSLVSH